MLATEKGTMIPTGFLTLSLAAQTGNVGCLSDLPNGCAAVIAAVDESVPELAELGFVPGSSVRLMYCGVGGDPRVYELDGSLVALRRAAGLHVQVRMAEPEAGRER